MINFLVISKLTISPPGKVCHHPRLGRGGLDPAFLTHRDLRYKRRSPKSPGYKSGAAKGELRDSQEIISFQLA